MNHISRILLAAALCGIGIAASAQEAKTFKTGKAYDLCEMFVVNKDYMDCATHYVRMHGFSQISEGGSCDDVIDVIRNHGICPESFVYEGKTYTPLSFAKSLGLNLDDYVSLNRNALPKKLRKALNK